MKTKSIDEALQMLQQIDRDSRDFIAPASKLAMTLHHPEEGKTVPELWISETEHMGLRPWAHNQLSAKLEIPQKYYDRMRVEEPQLLSQNVNTWLHKKQDGKFLVRTTGGEVRAILSDRYKPIPNTGTAFAVLASLNQIKQERGTTFTVRECSVSDTMMYMKVTSDTVHLMNPQYVHQSNPAFNGDPMFPGIVIRNSEVGASKFRVDVYTWRQICSNGAIMTSGISKVHLGRKIGGEGEISFSERTEKLDAMTILSGMNDIIKQVFDPDKMQVMIDNIKKGQKITVDEPVIAVENICNNWKLPDYMKDQILAQFTDKTVYGLGNAITAAAQEQENTDDQIRLEEIGGEILVLDKGAFEDAILLKEV